MLQMMMMMDGWMGYKNLKLCSSLCKVQIMDDDDDVWSE